MKKIKRDRDYQMANVLYQRLGRDWYAFAEHDGDVYMTKVDEEDVEHNLVAEKLTEISGMTSELRRRSRDA